MKKVKIHTKEGNFEGLLVNEALKGKRQFLIIKLASGYNVGVDKAKIVTMQESEESPLKQEEKVEDKPEKEDSGKDSLYILHTGGTIASKVDYRSGGVSALFTPEEIVSLFPEIKGDHRLEARLISNVFSEDMRFSSYNSLIEDIASLAKKDIEEKEKIKGVIITHGTDTLHYTSAALSFGMHGIPFPVVLVGAQRSSDRPSSDAGMNLVSAVKFIEYAKAKGISGVFACMHSSVSDDSCRIFRGVNLRKMHTSRRDAFRQVNSGHFADVWPGEGRVELSKDALAEMNSPEKKERLSFQGFRDGLRMGILYAHPGLRKEEILAYQGFHGLVIAGTGLGHLGISKPEEAGNSGNLEALKELIKSGTWVAVAPQAIYGRVNLNVYSTGRKLKEIGVLGDLCAMTLETAFIKLAYLVSSFKHESIAELYHADFCGENPRRLMLDE